MNKLAILLVVLGVTLAGCSKEEPAAVPTPTPPPPRPTPEFTLVDAALFEGRDATIDAEPPWMTFDYTSNVALNVSIRDADGKTIGDVRGAPVGTQQIRIPLTEWRTIPRHGLALDLRAVIEDGVDGRPVHNAPLEFEGQKVKFLGPLEVGDREGRIRSVTGTVRNEGDVPAYVRSYAVAVGGVAMHVRLIGTEIQRIQPRETIRVELRGETDSGEDRSVYPPSGNFTVEPRIKFHLGEDAVGGHDMQHGIDVVSVTPHEWTTDGLRAAEVLLRTTGNFQSSIGRIEWGFRGAKLSMSSADLGHGERWLLEPNREHKVILRVPEGAIVYPSPNETDLSIDIVDAVSQPVTKRTVKLATPEYDLASPLPNFNCPAPESSGYRAPCALHNLRLYLTSNGTTPIYINQFRATLNETREIVQSRAQAGAISRVETEVNLHLTAFHGLAYNSTQRLQIDAIARDGTTMATKFFDLKVKE